ncbi:MAG: tRNA (adenosine(37)-N6)-dimethylallyltransferase MiaA [Flavobacterium sp.]|nr:tRNA (adenosine(37)-N6)-dimethylallyltransferase MiaA [Pedobacter sp.]
MLKSTKTLIVIVGPTAIGKTDLAVKLATHYQTDIVSADSRQFYKEMHIGTAKPFNEQLLAAHHHFINSHNIWDSFSVGEYEMQALEIINNLFKSKNIVVLVGGSGLYVQAICQGFDMIPKAKEGIREKLNRLFADKGIEHLQKILKKEDPVYYSKVDLNNSQRIIRALEVWESTGKPFSFYRTQTQNKRPFNIIKIGLNVTRNELYQRINKRVDLMMQNKFLEEVKSLLAYKHLNSLNTVGYSELFEFLEGQTKLEEAIDKIKQNTRRFAKRQLTWFRKDTDIKWFEPWQTNEILNYLNHLLLSPEPLEQKN